jgi:hypothetical protein
VTNAGGVAEKLHKFVDLARGLEAGGVISTGVA